MCKSPAGAGGFLIQHSTHPAQRAFDSITHGVAMLWLCSDEEIRKVAEALRTMPTGDPCDSAAAHHLADAVCCYTEKE